MIPQIGSPKHQGYTSEEMKMVHETRKIMGDESIQICPTCVRVPVANCHSESILVETERKITVDEARRLFAATPGHHRRGRSGGQALSDAATVATAATKCSSAAFAKTCRAPTAWPSGASATMSAKAPRPTPCRSPSCWWPRDSTSGGGGGGTLSAFTRGRVGDADTNAEALAQGRCGLVPSPSSLRVSVRAALSRHANDQADAGLRWHGLRRLAIATQPAHAAGHARSRRSVRSSASRLRVAASGRTDAGVHALGQVVSFDTDSPLSAEVLFRALNAELPRDMAVVAAEEAPAGFHARRDARRSATAT